MIKIDLRSVGGWSRELEIEAPSEMVKQKLDETYRDYRKSLQLPGFRKGKVPLSIIKVRFGKQIEGEVLNNLIGELFQEARKKKGIEPISKPQVDRIEYEEGAPLRFVVSVEVKPQVEIGDYKGLEVTKQIHSVGDEEVEEQIHTLREENAVEKAVGRPAERGDVLLVDFQKLDDSGLPLIGQKAEEHRVLLGDSRLDPNLTDPLLGISKNEQRVLRLPYRDDQGRPHPSGREELFSATAKEVRERILPDLDDEFAKDLNLSSLEELRTAVRARLEESYEYISQRQLRSEIIDQLMREYPFEVPEGMLESYLEGMVEEARKQSKEPIEDEEALKEEGRYPAIRQIKSYLILEAISEKEGIKVSDEELDTRVRAMAEAEGTGFHRLKSTLQKEDRLESLRSDMVEEKIMAFLIEQVKIKEEVVSKDVPSRIIRPR